MIKMNSDTLRGEVNTTGGKIKEDVGSVTGDRSMEAGGLIDQVKGAFQKTIGGASDGGAGTSQAVGKAKQFAKDRPYATAALVGVVGMALLNSLRGR